MATITWKGEPGEGPDDEGPKSMTWGGVAFERGKAVEVKDEAMLERASKNRFFDVAGYEVPVEESAPGVDTLVYRPPSQQSAQKPAPKPGEMVNPDDSGSTPKTPFKAIPPVSKV